MICLMQNPSFYMRITRKCQMAWQFGGVAQIEAVGTEEIPTVLTLKAEAPMRSAAVEKEVRELLALAVGHEKKSEARQATILRRAARMLQEQQASLALMARQPIDLRPSKVEDNARMAKAGRAYFKCRKALKTADGSQLGDFHGAVDEQIAKD